MNPLIQRQIQANRERLVAICKRFDVKRLRIFGSAVGDKFVTKSSDLDLIVDFYNDSAVGIADRFLNLAEELEDLFQRKVDLLTERSIRNPIFRASIELAGQTVYES